MRGEDTQILCVRRRPVWCGEDVDLINSASESFPASLCVFVWAIELALWAFFNR